MNVHDAVPLHTVRQRYVLKQQRCLRAARCDARRYSARVMSSRVLCARYAPHERDASHEGG